MRREPLRRNPRPDHNRNQEACPHCLGEQAATGVAGGGRVAWSSFIARHLDDFHLRFGTRGPHGSDALHWPVPDPVRAGTQEAFDAAFDDLVRRIDDLAPRITAD